MKRKHVILIATLLIATLVASCKKEPDIDVTIVGDKDKIDIKGSLSNGDMKHPNIEAGLIGKTLYVYFHDYMGVCTVTISNAQDSVLFCVEQPTFPNAEVSHYMGDYPLGRYHLVISDGIEEAEGWFNNFKIVAVKPKS